MLKLNIYILIILATSGLLLSGLYTRNETKTVLITVLINSHRSFNWLVNRRSQNLNNKLLNFLRINTLLVHDADVWIITAPSCRLTHRGSEGIANFYPRVHLSSEFYFTPTKTSVKKRANATINKKKKYKTTWKLAISNIFGRQLLKFTIWSICDKKKNIEKEIFKFSNICFLQNFIKKKNITQLNVISN